MRILVTGANGMIGGEVVRSAIARGHRVTAVGRGPNRLPTSYGQADYYDIDLLLLERLEKITEFVKPDAIVHCGALTDVDFCQRVPDLAWKSNVEPTRVLAGVAAEIGARMVYVSTEGVFDGKNGPYGELDDPNPINVYGRTKLVGEWAVHDLCSNSAIARIGTVYGGRVGGKPTFADKIVENLRAGKQVRAFLDQICSTTYAPACGDRLVDLCENSYFGVLNTSEKGFCTRVTFAAAVANEFGLDTHLIEPIYMHEADLLARRPEKLGLDTRIAERILKHPPLDPAEALKRYRLEKETA